MRNFDFFFITGFLFEFGNTFRTGVYFAKPLVVGDKAYVKGMLTQCT